jgi:hypothetical protein
VVGRGKIGGQGCRGRAAGTPHAVQTSWLANGRIAVTNNSRKYSWDVEVDALVRVIFTPDSFAKDGDAAKEGDLLV